MSVSLRCYSTSLGCPKNRVDTERLLGSLGAALVPVGSPDEADLVFINTCAFIQPATEESVRTIAQAIADIEDLPKRPLLAVAGQARPSRTHGSGPYPEHRAVLRMAQDQRRLPPCLFVLRYPQYPGRAPLPLQGHDRPRGPRPAGSGGQGTESRGAGSHGMGV